MKKQQVLDEQNASWVFEPINHLVGPALASLERAESGDLLLLNLRIALMRAYHAGQNQVITRLENTR